MPTRDQVETAVRSHFDLWNAGDKETWRDIWSPKLVIFDPVGEPEKTGVAAIENMWERAFQPGHRWTLEPVFMSVCGDQAAVHVVNHANLNGRTFDLETIEIYWVGEDGRIARCHTYFAVEEGMNLDPYWMPGNS